ncbi:MAG: type II toxin-antitoxin system HicA family toxin [Alphaproteobacteria bacterium]|nr:type II toxin-antitoxin system HicA family toxin [Alphaproteobacteria bacterium]
MRPDEILRKLKKKFGTELQVVAQRGKGSHRTVYLRGRKTTLKQDGDMGTGTIRQFLAQLGLTPEDLG